MAKSSNTWCKKLMHKAKVNATKHKLGDERGLLARVTGEGYANARILDDRRAQLAKYKFGVVDGDMPDKPVHPVKAVREFTAPMRDGWKPRAFGSRKFARG